MGDSEYGGGPEVKEQEDQQEPGAQGEVIRATS